MGGGPGRRSRMVVLHSSDETYGADRMLLEVLAALPPDIDAEVWLPSDVTHPERPLCEVLDRRGVPYRHALLPVLRRDLLTATGLARLLARTFRLGLLLIRSRPHIVYCATSATLLGAPVARLVGSAAVLLHVQEVWAGAEGRVLGSLARACHGVVSISAAVDAALPPGLRRRSVIVENAVPDRAGWRHATGGPGAVRYLIASRWSERKGYRTLFRAWEMAGCPGQLVVLAGPPPGSSAVDVPELVATLSDPDSVEVVGEVAELTPYLDAADVVLMPSDEPEGFGLVPVEGFARARPAVVSDAGGLSLVVSDGRDGWVFPAYDALALSRLLRSLDRDRCAEAGRVARQTFERRFASTGFASRWLLAVSPWLTVRVSDREETRTG